MRHTNKTAEVEAKWAKRIARALKAAETAKTVWLLKMDDMTRMINGNRTWATLVANAAKVEMDLRTDEARKVTEAARTAGY